MPNLDLLSASRGLTHQQILATLDDLTDAEAEAILYDWPTWARADQRIPAGEHWRNWLILAGRGWGKTRTGVETVRELVDSGKYGRIALVGQTAADVRDVMVEGESGLLAASSAGACPKYEPSKRRITWPNGAIATTYSGDEPDQLRGPQHDAALADEIAKWKYAEEAWDNLQMGLRLGHRPIATITTTPRPIKIIKAIMADTQTVITRGNTYDNSANLAASTLDYLRRKYEGTRIGRQELYAEILDDAPGALWKREQIDADRVTNAGELQRIVIGVDPSIGDGSGDDCGIVAVGLGEDGHGYTLADSTLSASPDGWAREAVALYHRLRANLIVAEANQGGLMVELTIHTIDKSVPVKMVHASQSKQARAEPVAALGEQHRLHMAGSFPALEDELCCWEPGTNKRSPNRLDAYVWAHSHLMLEKKNVVRGYR